MLLATKKNRLFFINIDKRPPSFVDICYYGVKITIMKRTHLTFLNNWLVSSQRKPLVIRGARQVGKTWLVRKFAQLCEKELIEINFEKNPEYISLFSSNDPRQIITNLSAAFNKKIDPPKCILFLDEIQGAPELLSKLRWFAEDLPEMAVVGAGSLLEFTLEQYQFSMPVGRIQYLYLEPMSFEEFMLANDKSILLEFIKNISIPPNTTDTIADALHTQLIGLFKEYLIIGGMPAAVLAWTQERSLTQVNQIHHDLLQTYRDDFAKYSGRLDISILDKLLNAIPGMLGQKFVYSKVSNNSGYINPIKNGLDLINKAKICHSVKATAANGIPLGSTIKEKYFKELFLDTGLVSAMLGLNLNEVNVATEIELINGGALSEQVTGQLLRTIYPPYIDPQLYYWLREEKGASAELDYVIEHGDQIIPIEVKAGSTGSLKSLHWFMEQKELPLALRINSDKPSTVQVNVKGSSGKNVSYQLLSIPFYLISEIHRLI